MTATISSAQAWVMIIELGVLNALLATIFVVSLIVSLRSRVAAQRHDSPGA